MKSMSRQSVFTKWVLILTICSLFLVMSLPISTMAAGEIELRVQAGLGGEYKSNAMVPLQVEVTSTGKDIEGYVLVNANDRYELSGAYYQPLSIAKGTTKKVTLLVPGQHLNSATQVLFLDTNHQELAKEKIGGRNLSNDALLIGLLAANPNTANYLATIPKQLTQAPVRVVPLKETELPFLATALQSLNVLIINNVTLENVQPEQLQAIKEWTLNGGLLIMAGGPHYEKIPTALRDLSPVEVQGISSITSLGDMENVLQDAPLRLSQEFSVSQATLKGEETSQILFSEGNLPLLAVGEAGSGKVIYVAYDLAEEPLASWKGNSEFWGQLLFQELGSPMFMERDLLGNWWPLNSTVEWIPGLEIPNISIMSLIFAVYILLVGPLLYLILKRLGKRDWLWGIVPVLACLMGLVIYLYGAWERTENVLVHNVNYIELSDSERAKVMGAAAIFVPKGGEYSLQLHGQGLLLPADYGNESQEMKTWVTSSTDQAELTFKNIEYWGMRKAAIQQSIAGVGQLSSDLRYEEGKIAGTVTNNTIYSLRDVKIFYGNHIQDVDSLAPGESVSIDLAFDTAIRPSRFGGANTGALLPAHLQGQHHAQMEREARMIDMLDPYRYSQPLTQFDRELTLIGWTEEPILNLEVAKQSSKEYSLSLVKGALDIQPSEDGYFFIPAGTIEGFITENSTPVDHTPNGYMLPSGEVTFEFNLSRNEARQVTISKVHMYTWSEDQTQYTKSVYNWQTDTYDPYEQVFEKNSLAEEKINTYISEDGTLRMKMEHQQDGHRHLGHPAISVEGKVVK